MAKTTLSSEKLMNSGICKYLELAKILTQNCSGLHCAANSSYVLHVIVYFFVWIDKAIKKLQA